MGLDGFFFPFVLFLALHVAYIIATAVNRCLREDLCSRRSYFLFVPCTLLNIFETGIIFSIPDHYNTNKIRMGDGLS